MEQVLAAPWELADVRCVAPDDVAAVYRDHADFVWRSLQHLGVSEADLEDLLQEVFVVVHRRLHTYNATSRITTWLFGICLRMASRYHRRARLRRSRLADLKPPVDDSSPESACTARQARALLDQALAGLSLQHRAVFVLYEVEGQGGPEIAALLGIPLGTVYSRLHLARRRVTKTLGKLRKQGKLQGWP